MTTIQSLKHSLTAYDPRLAQTGNPIQEISTQEIEIRTLLTAIFAEIFLGNPSIIQKCFSYISTPHTPPILTRFPSQITESQNQTSLQNPAKKSPSDVREIIPDNIWGILYPFLTFPEQLSLATCVSHRFPQPISLHLSLKKYEYFFCTNGILFIGGYINRTDGSWSKTIEHTSQSERYQTPSGKIVTKIHIEPGRGWKFLGAASYFISFLLGNDTTIIGQKTVKEKWLALPERIYRALEAELSSNTLENQPEKTENQPEKTQFSPQEFQEALSKIKWYSSREKS